MDTHPTMNTVLPQLAAHGRIGIKPEITELKGRKVCFADGTEVEADLLVYATGYEIAFPSSTTASCSTPTAAYASLPMSSIPSSTISSPSG